MAGLGTYAEFLAGVNGSGKARPYDVEDVKSRLQQLYLLSFALFLVFRWELALMLLVGTELYFYLYCKYMTTVYQHPTQPPDFLYDKEELLDRICTILLSQRIGVSSFLSKWFNEIDASLVKEGNLEDFIAWAFFAKYLDHLSLDELSLLRKLKRQFIDRTGYVLEPGRTEGVEPIRQSLDDVEVVHRPFVFYFVCTFVEYVTRAILRAQGFRRQSQNGLYYWYRPRSKAGNRGSRVSHLSVDKNSDHLPPMVFFHGIGPGLTAYLLMLYRACQGRTALLFEVPYITFAMHDQNVCVRRFTNTVSSIMQTHNLERARFVGHSFGSLVVSWMIKIHPSKVERAVLLDPICFLVFLPHVAVHMLYRKPKSIVEHILHYCAAREMFIARTLKRGFFWYEGVLFSEELSCHAVVALGGGDELTPAEHIREYLRLNEKKIKSEDEHVTVGERFSTLWFPSYSHAQLLVSPSALRRIDPFI